MSHRVHERLRGGCQCDCDHRAVIDSGIAEVAKSASSLKARLRNIVALLNQKYSGGRTLCVLGQLATSSARSDAIDGLRQAFDIWITAIALLAQESGMPARRAKTFAEDWIARWQGGLQGALIMQAATGDTGPFERTLEALLALGEKGSA